MSEIVKTETRVSQLYGSSEELTELYNLCRKHAPWAEDLKDDEIRGVILRVSGMGYNPLNAEEVQVYPDSRNVIQVQPSYKFMVKWVERFHGSHTEPKYHQLNQEELLAEGLAPDAIATRVSFVMHNEQQMMIDLVASGIYDTKEARAMYEITGLGVASEKEYNAKSRAGVEYFAPRGRSKLWKVKKRALIDAYRHKYGTPSNVEVFTIRHELGLDKISLTDWDQALEVGADERGTLELAKDSARRRESPPITKEEAKAGTDALYGDGNGGTVDGVFQEMPEDTQQPDDFDFDSVPPIDPDATAPATNNAQPPKRRGTTRPADPATVKDWIERKAAGLVGGTTNSKQRGLVAGVLEQCFAGSTDSKQDRHFVQEYLTGNSSLGDVSDAYVLSLLDWLKPTKDDGGSYFPDSMAVREAAKIRDVAMEAAGQLSLS